MTAKNCNYHGSA